MDVQHFIDIVLSLLFMLVGGFVKMIHTKVEKNSNDLADFKEKVAEDYASKDDIADIKAGITNIQNFLLNQASNQNGHK